MRKLIVPLIAALTILSVAGLSFAKANPEASKAAKPRTFYGQVVSVNQEAKTLTVKKTGWLRKPKELTFSIEEKAAPTLADLKPGDRVKVTYIKEDGKLLAQTLSKTQPKAGKAGY